MTNKELNISFEKLSKEYIELKEELGLYKNSLYKNSLDEKVESVIGELSSEKDQFVEFTTEQKKALLILRDRIKQTKEKLDTYYSKLFKGDNCFNSKLEEIKTYYSDLLDNNQEDTIKDKIDFAYEELINYRNEIFGFENEDGKSVPGLKGELDALVLKFKEDSAKLLEDKGTEISAFFAGVKEIA